MTLNDMQLRQGDERQPAQRQPCRAGTEAGGSAAHQPVGARTTAGCVREWTKPKALTATAQKLARLIYSMLIKGQEYTDRGLAYYESRRGRAVL